MELIVVHLIEGTTPDKSPRDISSCLSRFMHEMNVTQLSDAIQKSKEYYYYKEKKGESSEIDGYLRSIWTSLLNCATHSSSSVRVAAYSATWSFLMKIMPTYPVLMRNSFSDIVDHFSGESNVSILLISSFAFISHFVSPNKMEEFLDKTPLFHHFIAKESVYSEHLSNIISNLSPHLSHEWFKNLLLAFIKLCKVSNSSTAPSRHVFKAIAALIKKNQKLLLPEILVNDEKNVFPGQLSLISFILSSPITSISLYETVSSSSDETSVNLDNLDLKKTAIAAFESLKNSRNSTLTEIDDYFSILSLRSKSFTITVTTIENDEEDKNDEKKFLISLENYGSFVFDDQKAIQRPSFYLLPLPMNLLIPNTETDSGSLIGIKLKTIGLMISDSDMIQDVDNEINMIDELCSVESYNETVSQCLQCLSLCVNSLILNTKSHKLSRLLRKLLFAKTVSWFHAYNILMVIKAIRIDLIPIVLGPSGFKDIVKTVVSFCMNINQDLSRSSFETIIKLTSDETFYEVTNYVANDIDFFNSTSLQKHLLILSGIIPLHLNQDRSHLKWLFYAVVESINYHIFDIDAAAAIFQFFSFFKMSKIPEETTLPIIKIAKMIIKLAFDIYRNGTSKNSMINSSSIGSLESYSNSSINLLNQESLLTSYDTNKFAINAAFKDIMRNYIESKKTEIVSPKSYDYQIHFIHIYSIMKFLLSLKPSIFRSPKMNKVLLWCFRMFPIDCSFYFSLRLKHFNNEQKIKIIKYSYPYLDAIPDMKVHAIWCEIAMLPLNFDDHNFKEFWQTFVRGMFESVRFYAKNQKDKKISLNAIIKFSYFLGFIKSRSKAFSINVDALAKQEKLDPSEEKDKVFSKYLSMFLSKLSDIKKIQFLQIAEKDLKFSSNFPDIIYNITAEYKVPTLNNPVLEMLSSFNNLIEPQKKLLLNEFSKPSFKLPPKIPDNVIEYSREKLYGWSLLSFYKKCLKCEISSSLLSEIKLELNVEPRAFNPVCQQSLIKEDPQKKLQFLSSMNSLISIKTVFCNIKEDFDKDPELIDFSAISFTQSMIPFVAKFIKKSKDKLKMNNKPNVFEKAEKKFEAEMHLIKYFFNPELEFKLEPNQRKLTKELMYRICHFMQEFHMTILGIEKEILQNLKETHSFNRTKALLTLASVHISILGTSLNKYLKKNSNESQLNKIDTEINNFVESIFIILKSKIEDNQPENNNENHTHHHHHNNNIIPQKELLNFALSVNNFQMHLHDIFSKEDKNNENSCNIKIRRKSKFGLNKINANFFSKSEDSNEEEENQNEEHKTSLEKYISFIDRYCNLYVFPDCLTLHLKISPRIKFVESINDIILNSNHPSFILQSIRALRCLVAIGDITNLRFHFNDYLTKFHQLQNIYPVSYYVSYFLVDIVGGSSSQFALQSSILLPNGDSVDTTGNAESDQSMAIVVINNESSENEQQNLDENKIMHSSPNLISSVTNTTNLAVLASIRNTITSELFPSILVPISRASFYPLAKVIVALIDSETNSKNKYYMKLIKECEKIIEDGITSFLHFKLYLEILTARIRKISEKSDKELVAKDSVIKLVRIFRNGVDVAKILQNVYNGKYKTVPVINNVPTFDSYFIDDYLNVFFRLMNEFMAYDDMILHFVSTVMPSVPRFFPSFVALAKILKQAKNKSDGFDKCILNAKKLLNTNQSKALDLILKGPLNHEILSLAEGTVETKSI